LPRTVVRDLLSMQTDMAILFLIPEAERVVNSPALRGTTSDQILRLESDPALLVEIIGRELRLVAESQPQYQIMCVDDDGDFLASLETLLPPPLETAFPRFRLDFDFFESPVDALTRIRENAAGRLALVISDQVMPTLKGIDFLRQVKEVAPDAQRVLLTGYASLELAIAAMNENVLDKYMTKPIDQPADFIKTVEHLLRSYHLRQMRDRQRARVMAQFEFIRAVTSASSMDAAGVIVCDFLEEQLALPRATLLLRNGDQLVVARAADAGSPWSKDAVLTLRGDFLALPTVALRPQMVSQASDLPWVADDLGPELPLLWVPLNWGGANLGLVLLAGLQAGGAMSRDQRMLVSFVADMASVTCGGLKEREALERLYLDTMSSLMEAVEAKDEYTRGHTDRVKDYALLLARAAGADETQLKVIEYAADLHDIGKIGVPDSIVGKPGRLNDAERAVMNSHSDLGDRILQPLGFLAGARPIVRSHHERYDGRGYPDGLAGKEIPLAARILAIADSYDAMTSARPYREAMDPRDALVEIEIHAGSQFDPELVVVFIQLMKSLGQVAGSDRPQVALADNKEVGR
jgi:response regulator RpfG family c-di-GMP phosphodiesterase